MSTYHLVNAATALARSDGGEVGSHNPEQDVTVFRAGPSSHERVLQRSAGLSGFHGPGS